MDFEYDAQKSELNKIKHGIDFEEAKALWSDLRGFEIPVYANGEERFVLIGRYRDRHWAGVYTRRNDMTRIISVRRARLKEIELYDNR